MNVIEQCGFRIRSMENDLVPLNIDLHLDLRKAQDKTVWCHLAATDTANDDDDYIYDSEHLLK